MYDPTLEDGSGPAPGFEDDHLYDETGGLAPRVKRLRGEKPSVDGFRTGAALLADADSQGLVGDLDGKAAAPEVQARAFYQQVIDGSKVRDKREVEDLTDAADFDEYKDAAAAFNADREYYHGWAEGEEIVLLRRDPATGKRIEERYPFEWYFYLTRADYDAVEPEKWAWLCRHHARRVEPDPRFPDAYVRVYVENEVPKFDPESRLRLIGDPEFGQGWSLAFTLGQRPHALRFPADRERWTPLHEVVEWCRRKGLEPLEADLSPKQRFLTDHDLRIQAKYHLGFVDIETDDSVGGFEHKEEARVLSIAWEGDRVERDPDDAGFLLLAEETDAAERDLLLAFKREVLDRYDVVAAWNGFGFDFPVLIARFAKHGIRVNWWRHLFADPLPVFKRHYVRAGADATSFALDSIGDKVLKMRKLDWRTTFRARHPGVTPTFLNLYRHDPDLLEEYNRYDSTILRKLEAFTGFVAIEQIFCRVANGFANDWNISTKIDQLLLKKGFKEGHHFRTRYWTRREFEPYEGAYVFPPIVGLAHNVCAFDFKSLYPSMVRAFNISPETIVRAEDRHRFRPEELCTCPVVELDEVDVDGNPVRKGGSTFRVDREGYISQMFVRTLERRKKYTDLQARRLAEVGTTQDDLYLLYYRLAYSFKRLGLSFYGDLGNPRSRYYDAEAAEAITCSGQYFIKETAKVARSMAYDPRYGDSVAGRRNVVLRDPRGRVRVLPVERWWDALPGPTLTRPDGKEVRVAPRGWDALSAVDGGGAVWAPVPLCVRHRVSGPTLRLTTPEGQVEVTEDHGVTIRCGDVLGEATARELATSGRQLVRVPVPPVRELREVDLLREVGPYERVHRRRVSPARHLRSAVVRLEAEGPLLRLRYDGEIGWAPAERVRFRRRFRVGSPELDDLLLLLGVFCAEGSVSFSPEAGFSGMRIGMDDPPYVRRLAAALRRLCPTMRSSGLTDGDRIVQCRNELTSVVFGRLCGVGAFGKRVPDFVFNLPRRERLIFLHAYLYGDGSYWKDRKRGGTSEDHDGWECGGVSLDLVSGLAVLHRQLDVPFAVRFSRSRPSGSEVFGLRTKKLRNRRLAYPDRSHLAKVLLEETVAGEYVYDLCVPSTQRFTEALGCVSVHNTDSLYIRLADEARAWASPEEQIRVLTDVGNAFVDVCQERYQGILRAANSNPAWNVILLEYEDIYERILFVKKKRYAGRMLSHKGERTSHLEVKGLEVMRSDVSGVTRALQWRVLNAVLLERKTPTEIEAEILEPEFRRCAGGELTVDDVVISKGISRDPDRYAQDILHVRLARKIRDYGHEFYLGMKIEYIVTGTKPTLQGILREDYEADPAVAYSADYYWSRVIYPPSQRVLEAAFPEKDWRVWLLENQVRRRILIERYKKWFLDPKRVAKAVEQIRLNPKGLLTETDLEELRAAPRVRALILASSSGSGGR